VEELQIISQKAHSGYMFYAAGLHLEGRKNRMTSHIKNEKSRLYSDRRPHLHVRSGSCPVVGRSRACCKASTIGTRARVPGKMESETIAQSLGGRPHIGEKVFRSLRGQG
jgi:hypothetical protein